MNVTCTGCPAKYAVPDEKVRGKKVRITCKHCGTAIVVDGSSLGAEAVAAPKAAEPAKASVAASETSYIVGFADDRQEPHTVSEIVQLYGDRKIDDEALVWKDGMADWLTPFDVPEIAEAMHKAGVARRDPFPLSNSGDDEPTMVARSPFDDSTEVTSAPRHAPVQLTETKPVALRSSRAETKPVLTSALAAATATDTEPATQAAALKATAAARRAESRSGAVDLFGGVSSAGSEADVSLDIGFPNEPEHKLTGARNESSVLFSLDALTKPDQKAAGQKKARDKEQEKEDSAALFGSSGPDSLMNIGGGGFLAAPDFTKPVTAVAEPQVRPSDPVEVPNNATHKKKGAGVWIVAVLGIAAAAAGAFFVVQKKGLLAVKTPDSPAAIASTTPAAQPSAAEPALALASPEPAALSSSAAAPSPAEAAAQALTAAGSKPAATPAAPNPTSVPAVKATEAKKPDTTAAAPAPATDDAPFDKGAAVAALGAAAANAGSCKKPDGPTGAGKVSVTFAPSGRATMTNVGGAFAGTEVGGCVARLFRAAKVPAFAGDPVTVSKSFSIE